MDFDIKLCEEKHQTVDRRLDGLHNAILKITNDINGKFTKVFIMFIGVLLSIIASLIIMIITRRM
jgi:hypothetical protein